MYFLDVTAWTVQNLVIRIVAAFILGALIGIDRGAKRREEAPERMLPCVWERRWS